MYSVNHATALKNKAFKPIPKDDTKVTLSSWSLETFKLVFIKENIVQRFMSSLQEVDIPMYTPYSENEIKEYLPSLI
jgi:hypothetical protein